MQVYHGMTLNKIPNQKHFGAGFQGRLYGMTVLNVAGMLLTRIPSLTLIMTKNEEQILALERRQVPFFDRQLRTTPHSLAI